MVGSGRISNSSKLLCMSSLPVSMKKIPPRTSEKKGQQLFSNYNTICCHGNQWSDLAEFQLIQASMYVLLACKYEKDQMKNSRENVMTSFSPLYVYVIFFRRSRATNSVVRGRISPNFELNQALMYVVITCKYEMNPIKQVRENVMTPIFPL